MIFSVELRPLALQDLQEAYNYYSTINTNLAEEFLQELQSFLNINENNPFICSYLKNPIRQGKIKRFPYDVIYEIQDDKIIVYDIFMAKQNPDKKRTS